MPLTIGPDLADSPSFNEGCLAMGLITADFLTGANADAVVLPYGRAVTFGATAPKAAKGSHENAWLILPTTAGQIIRGILMENPAIERCAATTDAFGNLGYPLPGQVPAALPAYATKGIIWVRTTEAVLKGDAVTTLITVGASQGRFGKTANASQIACPATWEWHSSAAANAPAMIYIK